MTTIAISIPGEPCAFARAGSKGKKQPLRLGKRKATDEQIIAAYESFGSVKRAGEAVGMCGQSVHERLKKINYPMKNTPLSDVEREKIKKYYVDTPSENFSLSEISTRLGRDRTTVCMIARQLGLTDTRRPSREETRQKMRAERVGFWETREHPRGMLGKSHSDEIKSATSKRFKTKWATDKAFGIGFMSEESRQARSDRNMVLAAIRPASTVYSRCKGGKREDLGDSYFRSSWEANYARYLNLLTKMNVISGWEYEPVTFWFEAIKRGVRSYKPDFRVTYKGDTYPTYIEVKGWMDDKSKTKIKRMRIYHPTVKLEVVGAKEYRNIFRKWASAIPTWEGGER